MHSNIFDRFSSVSLISVIVLLPIFCLPFTNIPIETSKGLLLVVGLVLSIIFWAIARFLDGKIIFPKSWLLLSGLGIVLSFLISALMSGGSSGNSQVSLFGTMFDIGSFWFIFAGFILMFFSSIIFRNPKQVKIVLIGTIVSSVLVLLFQSVHLFFPTILSLGILTSKTSNILGSWNALGVFAGFSGLMFLLVIEFFPVSKIVKIILQIFILLSILSAAVVNFPLVWVLLGVSSLIIFVYKVSITLESHGNDEKEKKHFPIVSFVVVIVSLLFFLSAGFFGNIVLNRLQISNNEVSLSLGATMSITKEVLQKKPILGIGPNRFTEAWAMYKPVSINTERMAGVQFWDVFFESGSGLLPTFIATTGYLGIIAWLVFLITFLIIGVQSVFFSIKNKANWEIMAFFILSLYLFISSFFYSTGIVIFLLSLAFTGVFIGLTASNVNKEISMSFLNDHRKSFFSILLLILLVIFSVAVSFKYIESFASVFYFSKALKASTISVAEESINKALALHVNDLYLRTYSEVYLIKLDSLVKKSESLSDVEKADLQLTLDQAVNGAQSATKYSSTNYLNFQALGSVYQDLASFGVKDVYNKAIEAYKIAITLNPNNPRLRLAIASAYFAENKVKDAKDYGNQALSLKPDYVEALIILSQISKSEGNNADALSYAEKALSISPANTDLIKYVASFKHTNDVSTPTSTTNSSKP